MIAQLYQQLPVSDAHKPQNSLSLVFTNDPAASWTHAGQFNLTTSGEALETAYTHNVSVGSFRNNFNEAGSISKYGDETNVSQLFSPETPTEIALLARRRVLGTDIDSTSREPIPRCHPGTRKDLCHRIVSWATDPNPHVSRLFWLFGPAGIGKSAISQTVAEELRTLGFLGGAFFFSKEDNRYDDPTRIISNLAYQLALTHKAYRRTVGEILAKDPTIVERSFALQFKELLIEPFWTIMIQNACMTHRPVVMVLDGLDEYHDKWVQYEIVRLIGHYNQSEGSPFMWIISSRPEWHLVFSKPSIDYIQEDLVLLGQGDIELYMRDRLQAIVRDYPELAEDWGTWPKGGDICRLIKSAGDLFTVAKSILDFISDSKYSDPSLRLHIFLNFPVTPSPLTILNTTENPFAPIHARYSKALSRFPRSLLPIVLQVFGLWCCKPTLTAFELANLLAIEHETLRSIFRHLHGLIRFSHDDKNNRRFLKNVHPSFFNLLSDPSLLHSSGITPETSSTSVNSAIAKPLLDLLLKPRLLIARSGLSWKSQPPQGFNRQSLAIRDLAVSNRIVASAMSLVWGFCAKIEFSRLENEDQFWSELFVDFNFGRLGEECGGSGRIPSADFRKFIWWLYGLSVRHKHQTVRTKPSYNWDQDFIDKCEGIAEPLDLECSESVIAPNSVHYVLLGVVEKTTLVLLTPDSVTLYSIKHLDDI